MNQRSTLTASNLPQCVLQVHNKGLRITNIGSSSGTTGNSNNMKSDEEKKEKRGKNSESIVRVFDDSFNESSMSLIKILPHE